MWTLTHRDKNRSINGLIEAFKSFNETGTVERTLLHSSDRHGISIALWNSKAEKPLLQKPYRFKRINRCGAFDSVFLFYSLRFVLCRDWFSLAERAFLDGMYNCSAAHSGQFGISRNYPQLAKVVQMWNSIQIDYYRKHTPKRLDNLTRRFFICICSFLSLSSTMQAYITNDIIIVFITLICIKHTQIDGITRKGTAFTYTNNENIGNRIHFRLLYIIR